MTQISNILKEISEISCEALHEAARESGGNALRKFSALGPELKSPLGVKVISKQETEMKMIVMLHQIKHLYLKYTGEEPENEG